MNQQITTALEVTLNLYDSIDGYKFSDDTKVKYQALGQCLRSLMETLDNDRHENATTQ